MNSPDKRPVISSILGWILLILIIVIVIERLGWSTALTDFFKITSGTIAPEPVHIVDARSNIFEIVWTFILASVLGGMIPYRGRLSNYQFSVLQAHMILSVSAAMMMMIIGSELARAFGLMGAAGIVRYRYRLISPKEGSTLIVALGVGMACGTGLQILAVISTIAVVIILNLDALLPRKLFAFTMGVRYTTQLKYTVDVSLWKESLTTIQQLLQQENIDYVITSTKHRIDEGNESDIVIEMCTISDEMKEKISETLREQKAKSFSFKDIDSK